MLCQLEGVERQKLNIFVKKLTLYINRIVIQIQIQYKIINTHSFEMKNLFHSPMQLIKGQIQRHTHILYNNKFHRAGNLK